MSKEIKKYIPNNGDQYLHAKIALQTEVAPTITATPDRADLTLARAIVKKESEEGIPLSVAGSVMAAVDAVENSRDVSAESKQNQPYLSEDALARVKGVIEYLKENKLIEVQDADIAIDAISRKTIPVQKSNSFEKKDMSLSEIAELARKEIETRIALEEHFLAVGTENKPQSLVDQAILNMRAINSWVAKGTWLNEYLQRSENIIVIHKSRKEYLRNNVFGMFFGIIFVFPIPYGIYQFTKGGEDIFAISRLGLSHLRPQQNLSHYPNYLRMITEKGIMRSERSLELAFTSLEDRQARVMVHELAKLSRMKAAKNILKSIKS